MLGAEGGRRTACTDDNGGSGQADSGGQLTDRKDDDQDRTQRYAAVPGWAGRLEAGDTRDVAGVATDRLDRVYALTRRPSEVLVYDASGSLLTAWGKGVFTDRAHGISVAPDGFVYCTDDADHTVRKFTPDGELVMTMGVAKTPSDTGYDGATIGSILYGGPPFNRPCNVAFGQAGEVFVADGYGNARVHKFAASGKLERSWGEPGTGPGEFNLPHGLAMLPDQRLLVADRENDRIQVFTLDGDYLTEWRHVQRPTQVAFDQQRGAILVSELPWASGERSPSTGMKPRFLHGRVSVLDADGQVLDRWGAPQQWASGAFAAPHGIASDSSGSVYVAEVASSFWSSRDVAVPAGCPTLHKFVYTP